MSNSPDRFIRDGGSPDRFVRNGNNSGGGHVIEDEGVPLPQRSNLNFVGPGVTATDSGGKTVVTIPGSGTVEIPQLDADPLFPTPESAWVRRTTGLGGGEVKFLFGGGTAITEPGGVALYEFSYRTLQNTTVRVTLA